MTVSLGIREGAGRRTVSPRPSCASFRRPPISGQVTFTVLSLHISNIYAKKKGIAEKLILTIRAVMIGQQIDVVAGDFNGTAWRCSNRNNISTIDEAFTPTPPGPTPLWDPDQSPTTGQTSVDSLSHGSDRYWKVRMHGAFIPRKALGLRPNDQSCHHETWLQMDFVDWRNTRSQHDEHDRRIFLKERPAPPYQGAQKRRISDIMSDHSLSS